MSIRTLEELENSYNFKKYPEKLQIAKDEGYGFFIERILESYKVCKSMPMVAKKNQIAFGTVKNIINGLTEEEMEFYKIIKRDKGGRSWSRLFEDDVRYIRSHSFMNIMKYVELAKELTEKKTKEYGMDVLITSKDVERCYNKKTHKEIKC